MKPLIYLAGNGLDKLYRPYVQEHWSSNFNFIDPIKNTYKIYESFNFNHTIDDVVNKKIKVPEEIRNRIVEDDKILIDYSDCVVAYIEKYTAGTLMEIHYSYSKNIPVYVVNPSLNFKDDIWLSYHSTMIFDSLDECMMYLTKEFKKVNGN